MATRSRSRTRSSTTTPLNGLHDPQTRRAANMTQIVAIQRSSAVIGPLNSSVALAQIPISNAAGLAQCSPANTNPDLTKGESRRADSRTASRQQLHPRRHHGRRPGPGRGAVHLRDARQEVGLHHRRHRDLREGRRRHLRGRASRTSAARSSSATAPRGPPQDYISLMTAAKSSNPESIYFGGVTAHRWRTDPQGSRQVGLGDIPYVGPDGINDGDADTPDSFLNLAGADAARTPTHPRPASARSRARRRSTQPTRPSTASTPRATRPRATRARRS